MKYCGRYWGRTLLFFVLLSILLISCSQSDSAKGTPVVSETHIPTTAPVVPSPTLLAELEVIEDSEAVGSASELPTASATPAQELEVTVIPTEEIEPTQEPEPTDIPVSINGMSSEKFILMSDKVRRNVGEIFIAGQNLGRDPAVFAILGDSLIATPQSLAKWDGDDYVLGEYEFLKPTLEHFAGSFGRYGVSVRVGLHSWSVFDPLWADKEFCLANEDLLTCELRLNNPSVMIIFLGSNDAGFPDGFDFNYRQIIQKLIEQGVVPVLATKADRFEGLDNINNEIIRQVAIDFEVPLLEFDVLADTLPGRGLSSDNVHLTYLEPLDYTTPEIFTLGYPVHNLASLMILDEVRQEMSE